MKLSTYIKICTIGILINFAAIVTVKASKRTASLNDTTIITGFISSITESDTLILDIHGELNQGHNDLNVKREIRMVAVDNKFEFKLTDITEPTYMTLESVHKGYRKRGQFLLSPIFYQYLVNPGDSICVKCIYYNNAVLFSGRGAAKMQCWEEISRLETVKGMSLQNGGQIITDKKGLIKFVFDNADTLLNYKLHLLEAYKDKLTEKDYTTFKADIIGEKLVPIYRDLSGGQLRWGDTVLNYYHDKYLQQKADTDRHSINVLSGYYAAYLYYKVRADQLYSELTNPSTLKYDDNHLISLFKQHFRGQLLDKILMQDMHHQMAKQKLNAHNADEYLATVQAPRYKDSVAKMKKSLGLGSNVSDYSFRNAQDKVVRLGDFKGKIILLDMWFYGCVGCTSVAHALPKVEETFKNKDVVFISLCADKNKQTWLKGIKNVPKQGREGFTLPMYYTGPDTKYLYTGGTGFDDKFIRKYNPTGSFPRLLLIDKTGKLISANPTRPDQKGGQEALINEISEALAH